jgi:SAM-dependent methyltransferase
MPQKNSSASSTQAGYDLIAQAYADHVYGELAHKPFDRAFLDRLAADVPAGQVLDVGCGPGHVTRYLADRGMTVQGLDLSGEMVAQAHRLNPGLPFLQGDMRALPCADASLAAVVAFYAVIHFPPAELQSVFTELARVLRPGGLLALAFHVGDEVRQVEALWGVATRLDFHFFQPDQVVQSLQAAGLTDIELTERPPYDATVEAQTQRCYLRAHKPSQ